MEGTMSYILSVSLMAISLIMNACASDKPIYTSAFYSTLPSLNSRVFVAGNNMAVLTTTETWLQDRGLYPIDRNAQQANAMGSPDILCPTRCDTGTSLDAAKTAGADYLILFNVSMEHAPERMLIIITGLAIKTGEEIFRAEGTELLGSEGMHPDDKNEALNHILCHTLATVWQYRPGGYLDDRSNHYCQLPPRHT
jgi:hypothetical protein